MKEFKIGDYLKKCSPYKLLLSLKEVNVPSTKGLLQDHQTTHTVVYTYMMKVDDKLELLNVICNLPIFPYFDTVRFQFNTFKPPQKCLLEIKSDEPSQNMLAN